MNFWWQALYKQASTRIPKAVLCKLTGLENETYTKQKRVNIGDGKSISDLRRMSNQARLIFRPAASRSVRRPMG